MRQPVGHPDPALAVLLPLAPRGQQGRAAFAHRRDHRLEARRQRLAGQPVELGLGVERIEMARPAFHEQERSRSWPSPADATMQKPDSRDAGSGPASRVASQQVAQRQRTKAGAGVQQPVATGQRRQSMGDSRVHDGHIRISLVDIQKLVGIKEHMTEVDERLMVGRRSRSFAGAGRSTLAWRSRNARASAISSGSGCRPKARR